MLATDFDEWMTQPISFIQYSYIFDEQASPGGLVDSYRRGPLSHRHVCSKGTGVWSGRRFTELWLRERPSAYISFRSNLNGQGGENLKKLRHYDLWEVGLWGTSLKRTPASRFHPTKTQRWYTTTSDL